MSVMPFKDPLIFRLYQYFRVGYLLHIIGIASLLIAVLCAIYTSGHISPQTPFLFVFWWWLCTFFLFNAAFSQLDARSRYQNYKQLRDQLYEHGYAPRLVKPMAKSKCQRQAALAAASDLGLKAHTATFFKSLGYRWYHVLPDFLVHTPSLKTENRV